MTDVDWLSADEQMAWRTYLRGVSVVLDTLNQDLETEHGVSLSEYEVLSHLSEAPEQTIRMSTLADKLVHSRSRLTHTVRRLEKQGYVIRVPCAEDGRGVNCVLTEQGFEKLRVMAPFHVHSVRRCLVDKLGHDQMIELGRLCRQLIDAPAWGAEGSESGADDAAGAQDAGQAAGADGQTAGVEQAAAAERPVAAERAAAAGRTAQNGKSRSPSGRR